jgi:hypothetical protein
LTPQRTAQRSNLMNTTLGSTKFSDAALPQESDTERPIGDAKTQHVANIRHACFPALQLWQACWSIPLCYMIARRGFDSFPPLPCPPEPRPSFSQPMPHLIKALMVFPNLFLPHAPSLAFPNSQYPA